MAEISTDLLIKITAQNTANSVIAGLDKQLSGLRNTVLGLASAFAFKNIIDSTEQWGLQVHQLASELGLTATQASRLNYVGQALGISTDEMTTAFGRLAKEMFNSHKNAGSTTDMFQKWNVTLKDSHGTTKNIIDVLEEASNRVQQLGDSAASRALEMDLFGRSGGRLHDLLMQGAAGVKQLTAEADAMGLTLDQKGLAALDDFRISMNKFNLQLDAVKLTIGQAILPILQSFLNWVRQNSGSIKSFGEVLRLAVGHLKDFWQWITNAWDAIKGIFGSVGATQLAVDALILALAAVAGGPVLFAAAAVVLAYQEVDKTVRLITDHWELWRQAAHSGMLEMQGDSNDLGRLTVKRLVEWGDFFDNLGTRIHARLDFLGTVFSKFGTMLVDIWNNIKEAVNGVEFQISQLLNGIINFILPDWLRQLLGLGSGGFLGGPPAPPPPGPPPPPPPGTGGSPDEEQRHADMCNSQPGYRWNWTSHSCDLVAGNTQMATGGIVTRPTVALVGEHGPEAVIPLGRGSGVGNVYLTINVSGNIAESERELAEKVGDVMLRELGHIRGLAY